MTVCLVATSSLSCSYDSTTYSIGTTGIKKSDCETCQCLARTLYSSSNGLTCHTIQCPVPDCPDPTRPSGQCCPRCSDVCDDIEITNCPSSDVRVSLPSSRDDVLYRFVPTTRDCDDEGRAISISKSPSSNIYQWNGETGHEVTITATAQGASDAKCVFRVIPVGKSSLLFCYHYNFSIFVNVSIVTLLLSLEHFLSKYCNAQSDLFLYFLLYCLLLCFFLVSC